MAFVAHQTSGGRGSRVRIRHLPQWSWCAAGPLCNNIEKTQCREENLPLRQKKILLCYTFRKNCFVLFILYLCSIRIWLDSVKNGPNSQPWINLQKISMFCLPELHLVWYPGVGGHQPHAGVQPVPVLEFRPSQQSTRWTLPLRQGPFSVNTRIENSQQSLVH